MAREEFENVFRTKPKRPADKAAITDSVARAIVKEELDARASRTAALRAARLAHEAESPPEPAKPKRRTSPAPRFRKY